MTSPRVSILYAAPEHAAFIAAAADVAAADGYTYLGRLLSSSPGGGGQPLLAHVSRGALDADYPVSGGYILHLYHFHDPWTHRGFAGACHSAASVADILFTDALSLWRQGGRPSAAYELGRASHLLVDCFVPYHAAGVAGCGHGPYEAWLADGDRWRDYVPGSGGRYEWQAVHHFPGEARPPHAVDSRCPADWVDHAAHQSWVWYRERLDGCKNSGYAQAFDPAATDLVAGTVRYLAGFLHYFFTLAGAAPPAAALSGAAPPGAVPPGAARPDAPGRDKEGAP